jgi:hypothetical protein
MPPDNFTGLIVEASIDNCGFVQDLEETTVDEKS